MKKTLLIAFTLVLSIIASAQNSRVLQSDYSQIRVNFKASMPAADDVTLFGQQFNTLKMDGFNLQANSGLPALPTLVSTIEIPLGGGLKYRVESIVCDTVDGSTLGIEKPIVPAQPSLSKSDPMPTAIVMDRNAYSSNSFLGAPVIEIKEIGIARNRNLANIIFNPICWNPVTNQIVLVKEMTIAITQDNTDIEATRRMQRIHSNPVFGANIKTINTLGPKENYSNAPLRYTIVAHSSFRGELDDFAAWKRRKGFIVDLVYTDDDSVGSTPASIRNYLQGLYDNATTEMPAPTYVLLVGDVAQIPAFYLTAYGESHYSDLSYCCWTGDDNLPDCYYGRFSAQNLEQLLPQIYKTMMYEQYTFPDPSYLSTAALVAGVDGGYSSDNAYKYGDPAMDYVAKLYVTTNNGFNNIVYYKNNTSFAPMGVTVTGSSQASGTAAALRTLYNNGCGWVNYTAHGSNTSWSDPSFTTTDVSQMTNNNKPMIAIGNCCLSNSFQVDACLGEALLRKGNNAGAVAYIGGSNSTYWSEDFYWTVGVRTNISNTMNTSYNASNLGMYDRLYHTHNEAASEWYTTMGSMIFAGNWAVQGSSASDNMKLYYWQIYHLMGDPSLMPYIHGQAATITASMPNSLTIGANSLNVSAVPYAYIAFNDDNGNLLATAFADASGNATLSFSPISSVGNHEIVITAQGYQPYIQEISVIANGPYVNVTSFTTDVTPTTDAHINFNVAVKNMGTATANNMTLELQCLDGSILLDTTGQIDLQQSLEPNGEITLDNFIGGYIWPNITDQSRTTIKAIVRWGNTVNDLSYSNYTFTINSDKIIIQNYNLGDFADDTARLSVTYANDGHQQLSNATLTLLPLDPSLFITQPTTTVNNLSINQSITVDYTLNADCEIPVNRYVPFMLFVDKGTYTYRDTLMVLFGEDLSVINFENNAWGNYPWTHGENPWTIVNQNAHNGTYCARSKNWTGSNGNNQTSDLSITWTSTIDDSISFYKNVSSEQGYDKFYFYIDGEQMESLSGTDNSWSRSAYLIPAGTHTFKFSYSKDNSVSRGSDCAWIDDLCLPTAGLLHSYVIDSICRGEIYTFNGVDINTDSIQSEIYQCTDTAGNTIIHLALFINEQPVVTISATADTIRAGETVRLTATGAQEYAWNSGETNPIIDVYPTETTTYSVTGYNGSCSSTESYTIVVDGTIGIHAAQDATSYRIYPNPAKDKITVEGPATLITLSDVSGRRIITHPSSSSSVSFDISNLPLGIYFIQTTDANGGKNTFKLIKK